MRRWKVCALIVALLIGTQLLAGCTDEDFNDVASFFKDWAVHKGLITADGKPNYRGILAASLSDDPTTGALLMAGDAVSGIVNDDNQANAGLAALDPAPITAAIKDRPKDYRYYDQRGAVLLARGDAAGADRDFATAARLAQKYGGPDGPAHEAATRQQSVASTATHK